MTPKCRICGNAYQFPECELESLMYPRAGQKGPWERSPGADDKAKFESWTQAQIAQAAAEGREPGDLGLNLLLLGRKEGLKSLVPLLSGTQQQKWDFIVKRMFPFSFTLTHARPGGYETDRLKKWLDQNFERLRWSDAKKAFVVG
jgi:hypothetical protein